MRIDLHVLISLIVFLGLAAIEPARAGVLYVSWGGQDQTRTGIWNDCTGPLFPCRTIQRTIDLAGNNDEIRVRSGAYNMSQRLSIAKSISGLKISGGWSLGFESHKADASLTLLTTSHNGILAIHHLTPLTIEVTIEDFLFRGDGSVSNSQGGAIRIWALDDANVTVTLSNLEFDSNSATSNGGAVFAQSWRNGLLELTVTDCVFKNNRARAAPARGSGGAIALNAPGAMKVTLKRNVFFSNVAGLGGAIHLNASGGNLELNSENDMIVFGAAEYGAGVYASADSNGTISLSFTNDTIFDNDTQGVIVVADGPLGTGSVEVELRNTILWGNGWTGGNDLELGARATAVADHSDMGTISGLGTYTDDGSNISADPMFEDAYNWDYHLTSSSPAVDAGICGVRACNLRPFPLPPICFYERRAPYEDFEGDARPTGTSGCDIGADEYVPEPSTALLQGTALMVLMGMGAARRKN